MKGTDTFSKKQDEGIKALLQTKIEVDSAKQKLVRDELRKNFNFFISDFTDSKNGFNPEMFDDNVSRNIIRLI